MVESLSERLTDGERKDFASQLPRELKEIALSTSMASRPRIGIVEELMEKESIREDHAKKQVLSAWRALKDTVSPGEINDIRAQLPGATAALLY